MVGFKQKALFPKPNLPFSRFIKWSHRLPVLPVVVDGGWVSGPLHSKTIPAGNTSRIPSRWYHRFSLRETESHARSRVQGRKHSFLSSRTSYYYTDTRVSHTTLLT